MQGQEHVLEPVTEGATTISRTSAALLLAVGVMASTAACTADQGPTLSRDDFKPGVCRDSAQPVIDVRSTVKQLQEGTGSPREAADTLKKRQSELRAKRDRADESLRAKLSELTNAIGVLRIGIDAGTVGSGQTEDVTAALDRVIRACSEG